MIKTAYLESIFLNIVAVTVLPSPLPLEAASVVVSSKDTFVGSNFEPGQGISLGKAADLEIVLLR